MVFPDPPKGLYEAFLRVVLQVLNLADVQNRKKLQDVELGQAERLIIRSPNGTRYSIVVSNVGVVTGTVL